MSLHELANHMQSRGRGEDSVLVHMTPKEVHGLQALAKAHGGSLTINPETGLAEAGFLSSILPMVAGLALAPLTAGTSLAFLGATPFATALTVGGATGLATGSLKKGLMAGLGAYGGAGLGASLAGMGGAAAEAGLSTAGSVVPQAATPLAQQLGAGATGATTGAATASGAGLPSLAQTAAQTNASILNSPMMTGLNPAAQMTQMVPAATQAAYNPTLMGAIQNASGAVAGNPGMSYGAGMQGIAPTAQGLQSVAPQGFDAIKAGAGQAFDNPMAFAKSNMSNLAMAGAPVLQEMMKAGKLNAPEADKGMIRPYTLERTQNPNAFVQSTDAQGRTNVPVYGQPFDSSERSYFTDRFVAGTPYAAPGPEYKATGGLTALAIGGPVEEMAAQNAVGQNTGYPMANLQSAMYTNPQISRPTSTNVLSPAGDANVDPYSGEERFADGGNVGGGYDLGGYSDGGRLLRGPGDGVSDSIPASIGDKQPARLADGEFVVPARIVSELGNGSTEAGARQLYKMMERVQHNRRKSVGKDRVAVDAKSAKFLPA